MTTGNSTYGGAAFGSTTDEVERDRSAVFRVTRDGDVIEDAVFDVDPVVDTSNPFGDFCVIKMDDRGGEKFAVYNRGTRVDVAVSEGYDEPFENRFTGYVVERRETEQSGADVLEVEAYSFDQFLRRNTVTNDQSGNTIAEALADIIQTDTPVAFDPALVDVGDDQELTRTYQGEAVETVLRDLAFKSNNEDFGVTDALEFFFRERETTHIDRGIDNTQWFNYDIPELGKETVNEVEVWFDDGNESVIVDDGTDKLDLQDSLGLPDPGTQRAELNRPLITDINDAEDEGRKYLEFRNATLSGTVTTFGLFNARPGDTIDIKIAPRGIDDEFVIAACEYRWGVDETILTIVEKRGDVDDILSELNESVQRVEMENADRDAPKNRITTTDAGAVVSVEVTPEPDAVRFVNDGRRAVRDTWTGDPAPNIATLVVGDDGTGLSRSNSEIRNQTNSASVTQTLPDATSVTFEATITQAGVREVGLETADGRLVARAVYLSPIDLDGTVSLTLAVSNDVAVSRGVLTTNGQTAVRDVLADNAPALPNAYAYGDSGTEVSEADSALGNELVEVSLEEVLVGRADTTAQWADQIDIPDGTPATTDNDALETTQTLNYRDGFNEDASSGPSTDSVTGADYVDGSAVLMSSDGQTLTYNLAWYDHAVPQDEVGIAIRLEALDESEFEIRFNGDIIDSGNPLSASLRWADVEEGFFSGAGPGSNTDLEPGNTYQLEIETLSSDAVQELVIDQIVLFDRRHYPSVGNWSTEGWDTVDGNQQLPGPPTFPSGPIEFAAPTINTRRDITEFAVNSEWNSTANEQFIEARIGNDAFTRENNSGTVSITGGPDSSADLTFGLSNSTTTTTDTPTQGDTNQSINSYEATANPDATVSDDVSSALTRAIVPPNTLTAGTTLREAGLKSGSTLLTRHELADFDVLTGQRIASAEGNRFTGEN